MIYEDLNSLQTKKNKSCKSFDLQDSVAEREEFYTTLPSSVTRWYSSAVFRHFRLFCTKNGAELAQDKISLKNKNLSDIFFDVYILASRTRLQVALKTSYF